MIAASWTQAAGTQFYAANINLAICSKDGAPATGAVYLTNALGPSATSTNTVASASVSTSAVCSASTASSPAAVLSNVTLPASASAVTYYLVLNITTSNLGLQASNAATETPASGVTINTDQYATSVNGSYPPGSTFTNFGSPSRGILFSVAGTAGVPVVTPPTGVPTLGTFGMIGTGMLLGFAGLLFLRRESVNPLR